MAEEQMKSDSVPLLSMTFEVLKQGFFRFRKEMEGKVYFARVHPEKKGKMQCFPVLSDGTISRVNMGKIDPDEIIEVLRPLKLGISEVEFSDEAN